MSFSAFGNQFETLEDYFEFISNKLGYQNDYHLFKQDYVQCDGNRLHLEIVESKNAKASIIVIPGTGMYALCFAHLMLRISEHGYNVIGIDLRGHGRSEGQRGDYTIKELMRDTQAAISYAIENYGENVSLLGSSQGGIVAFYLAAEDDRIQSVICQNLADLTAPETVLLTRFYNVFKILRPALTHFGDFLPNTQIPITAYLNLEKIKLNYFGNLKRFLEEDPLVLKHISLRALRSLGSTGLSTPISQIHIPVLVLTGDKDSIFPIGYTKAIYKKIKAKKRLKIYPDADHAILHENADEVEKDVSDWLSEIYSHHRKKNKSANDDFFDYQGL